ncbi:hypothetical protein CRENBAI_024950 [Crenichthys baileyi]|uniref:Interleukin-2 receptor subunit beta N-terminal domain-containing protein n=1 Tax=Crenichthys baileyi TaxID=28760 RepID=A0AAV9R9V7_9TELE
MGGKKFNNLKQILSCFTNSAEDVSCSSLPLKSLTCYNDFNHTINCVWNSSAVYVDADDVCTVHAEYKTVDYPIKASCDLKSFDVSKPALKNCSLFFKGKYLFWTNHNISINVNCMPSKRSESIFYKPSCHIKVNPPGKPNVNQTTVTWFTQVEKHKMIRNFRYQLQWKQKDESWHDSSEKTECQWDCETQLKPSLLMKNETYEARVRVQAFHKSLSGTWSEWSPTESWVSQVGRPKPASEWAVSSRGVLTLVSLVLLLAGIVFLIRKKNMVYVVKSFKGAPLPDPGKSEIFQNWFTVNSKGQDVSFASNTEKSAVQTWLSSHFNGECVQSFLSSVDIVSYEVTSTVDAMKFCKPDIKLTSESNEYNSSCSSFSNPSYSEICASPCVSTMKLQASVVDAPYKPVRGQTEEKNTEQDSDFVAKKDLEMVKLLFMGGNKKEAVVISDYEKVEKQLAERLRLHSVDSGMCSYEEVSQESMEADSINMTDGHDEGIPHKQEQDEENKAVNKTKLDFKELFGGGGVILGKNIIQICSDYKQIPRPSCESGLSIVVEENERQEDSTEDYDKPSEATCFLSPPHPPSTLP